MRQLFCYKTAVEAMNIDCSSVAIAGGANGSQPHLRGPGLDICAIFNDQRGYLIPPSPSADWNSKIVRSLLLILLHIVSVDIASEKPINHLHSIRSGGSAENSKTPMLYPNF